MVWSRVVGYTSQSNARLLTFGGICMVAFTAIGFMYAERMAPRDLSLGELKKREKRGLSEWETSALARQERVTAMVKDAQAGQIGDHWARAMKGTLMPHPVEQTKTIAHTRDVLAKAKEKADALQKRGWWSLR